MIMFEWRAVQLGKQVVMLKKAPLFSRSKWSGLCLFRLCVFRSSMLLRGLVCAALTSRWDGKYRVEMFRILIRVLVGRLAGLFSLRRRVVAVWGNLLGLRYVVLVIRNEERKEMRRNECRLRMIWILGSVVVCYWFSPYYFSFVQYPRSFTLCCWNFINLKNCSTFSSLVGWIFSQSKFSYFWKLICWININTQWIVTKFLELIDWIPAVASFLKFLKRVVHKRFHEKKLSVNHTREYTYFIIRSRMIRNSEAKI